MKDNVLGYEGLNWVVEHSDDGFFVVTATPRMQRAIAERYRDADVCVFDFPEDKPYYFAMLAALFRDEPGKRAYFLLNVQRALSDDAAIARFNFSRDMMAREKRNLVFFMTEEAAQRINRQAYDFHSYVRLFLDFEDDLPDETTPLAPLAPLPDRSVGVAPPEIDFGKPRNALLAQAIALRNRAKQFFGDARYRDAETLLRGALNIRERLLDKEHPDVAAALHALGETYEKMGRYDEARAALQRALDIRTHTLGERHPDTAASCDSLATVYRDMGEYNKALALFQTALSIREQVFGTEHPTTAATYNNVALVYDEKGDYDKALAFLQKALAINERVYGADHPTTATNYNNIALVYDEKGDYDKALAFYQKALAIRERVLGTDHPDTATTYNNVAIVYHARGEYDRALAFYQKALAICERVLGKEHPRTRFVRNNLELLRKEAE